MRLSCSSLDSGAGRAVSNGGRYPCRNDKTVSHDTSTLRKQLLPPQRHALGPVTKKVKEEKGGTHLMI